jgi:hypothetical protein
MLETDSLYYITPKMQNYSLLLTKIDSFVWAALYMVYNISVHTTNGSVMPHYSLQCILLPLSQQQSENLMAG